MAASPRLDAGTYRLAVGGRVRDRLDLSLDDLRARFEHHTVVATMQCAGNRRADLHRARPVSGDPWEVGAIGNAAWTGVRLADILRAAGADEDPSRHVAFAAHDVIDLKGEHFRFGVSIPVAKALAPEVLVAWAMNGDALAPEHGYPLRLVVPGFAGIRFAEMARDGHRPGQPVRQPHAGARLQDVPARRVGGERRLDRRRDHPGHAADLRDLHARRRRALLRRAGSRSGATPPRPAGRSRGSTCRPMAGGRGGRPSWSTIRARPGAGRCGAPRWS